MTQPLHAIVDHLDQYIHPLRDRERPHPLALLRYFVLKVFEDVACSHGFPVKVLFPALSLFVDELVHPVAFEVGVGSVFNVPEDPAHVSV